MPPKANPDSHVRANKGVEPKSSFADTVAKMDPRRLERSPRLSEVTPLAVLSAPSIEIDPTTAGSRQEQKGNSRASDTVINNLRFFDAWEKGLLPNLSAFLRARQIRRGDRAVRDNDAVFRP
jgi:hypothetical protein